MKASDLIALLKDARGALHGANHALVDRVDAAVAELEKAQSAAKPAPQESRYTVKQGERFTRTPQTSGPLPE